jgi:hypothetical protein
VFKFCFTFLFNILNTRYIYTSGFQLLQGVRAVHPQERHHQTHGQSGTGIVLVDGLVGAWSMVWPVVTGGLGGFRNMCACEAP